MTLIATRPVLYLAHQYSTGDELPTSDSKMVSLWVAAGSAVWKEEASTTAKKAKAKPATAEPGVPGMTDSGNEEDLAGKITPTPERKKSAPRKKKTSS